MAGTREFTRITTVLDQLHEQGAMGLTHCHLCQQLATSISLQSDLANIGRTFFAASIAAHFFSAVLYGTKLLSQDHDEIHVTYLLNLCERASRCFPHGTEEDVRRAVCEQRAVLDDLRGRASDLRQLRDKVVAHLDRVHVNDPASLVRILSVAPKQLEELFKKLGDVVNLMDKFARNQCVVWRVDRFDDYKYLEALMRQGREAQLGGGNARAV